MKYIRTKDGRIIDLSFYKLDNIFKGTRKYIYKPNCGFIFVSEENIVKEADNIEELCDEFVYSDKVFKNVIYENYNALKMLLKIRKNYIVYGAIWTDKGLIYVAKMNEKGKMELL